MAKSIPKKGTLKMCLYLEQDVMDAIRTYGKENDRKNSYVANKILREHFSLKKVIL